jgi:hypothetical protein
MKFTEYIKSARNIMRPDKYTEEDILRDLISSNLRVCKETIRCAEHMNGWGRHAHAGHYTLNRIRPLHEKISTTPTLEVNEDDFTLLMQLQQTLGNTMWRVEHNC